jgi:TolB protein
VVAALTVLIFPACDDDSVGPQVEPQDQLLFLSTRVGDTDAGGRDQLGIYRVNADGTGVERLPVPAAAWWESLSLSPDGRRLAAVGSFGHGDLWVMNTDGTDLTQLTDVATESGRGLMPRWSPDGRKIAFILHKGDRKDVYVMDADGSDRRNLTHELEYGESNGLDDFLGVIGWSPDGQIVFEKQTYGGGDPWLTWHSSVYVVNTDGSGLRLLFDTPGDHSPAWSPDGSKIAFIRAERLHIMNADGSGVRALTSHADGTDLLPQKVGQSSDILPFKPDPWSPDGSLIAFDRVRGEDRPYGTHVISADGSDLRELTQLITRFNGWSPSGTRIALTRLTWTGAQGGQDVLVVFPDGRGLRNLTDSPHHDQDAFWLPSD